MESAITSWEAHKATMRGHCIQLASSRKWDREKKFQELSAQLASAVDLWKSHPNPVNKKTRDAIAAELDLLASKRTEQALRWTKHGYYACANKPGTMLARKLNTSGRAHKPICLCSTNGDLTSDQSKISMAFINFSASLYSTPPPFPLDLANNFFS